MSDIFTGKDALKAVGASSGKWNWALVGADHEKLPLAGGGSGGIDEMRECLDAQGDSVLFGLIRCTFSGNLNKYVFIHASRANAASGKAVIAGGQATALRPTFEKLMKDFAQFKVTFELQDPEDLTVKEICNRVAKSSTADSNVITEEIYFLELKEFQANLPAEEQATQEAENFEAEMMGTNIDIPVPECTGEEEKEMEVVVTEDAPPVVEDAAPVEVELALPTEEPGGGYGKDCAAAEEEEAPEEFKPQVMKVPTEAPDAGFHKGQHVYVFSAAAKQWLDDGTVMDVLTAAGTQDGLSLPAGAVKVQYSGGKRAKWVPPEDALKLLRAAPPAPTALVGELMKETHNLFTEWHKRHFQLSKGFIQWWLAISDAKGGTKPNGSLCLAGLQMQRTGSMFRVKTASSKGVVYAFDAGTVGNAKKWCDGLEEHVAYCDKMKDLFKKA